MIQVGGGSKEVFYYPKDAMSVTAVGMDFNKGEAGLGHRTRGACGAQGHIQAMLLGIAPAACPLTSMHSLPSACTHPLPLVCAPLSRSGLMQQAGMQAGVPTVVRSQDPDDLSWLADGTVDAVVVLRRLGRMTPATRKAALSEASRVLKPGRPLIFIERVREGGSPLRPLLGGSEGALATSELEALRDNSRAWSYVQWDVALAGQDPHAVGVAVRSEAALPRKARQAAAAAAEAKEAPKAPPKRAKGFSA